MGVITELLRFYFKYKIKKNKKMDDAKWKKIVGIIYNWIFNHADSSMLQSLALWLDVSKDLEHRQRSPATMFENLEKQVTFVLDTFKGKNTNMGSNDTAANQLLAILKQHEFTAEAVDKLEKE